MHNCEHGCKSETGMQIKGGTVVMPSEMQASDGVYLLVTRDLMTYGCSQKKKE